MSTELEKRLRALCDAEKLPWVPLWARLFTAAARIGAEVEREEIAAWLDSEDEASQGDGFYKEEADFIRARGTK